MVQKDRKVLQVFRDIRVRLVLMADLNMRVLDRMELLVVQEYCSDRSDLLVLADYPDNRLVLTDLEALRDNLGRQDVVDCSDNLGH